MTLSFHIYIFTLVCMSVFVCMDVCVLMKDFSSQQWLLPTDSFALPLKPLTFTWGLHNKGTFQGREQKEYIRRKINAENQE